MRGWLTAGHEAWSFGDKEAFARRRGRGGAASGGHASPPVTVIAVRERCSALEIGEALLESGVGEIMTGDGLEGVFELATVARQLVSGQGVHGMRGSGRRVHQKARRRSVRCLST